MFFLGLIYNCQIMQKYDSKNNIYIINKKYRIINYDH